MRHGNLVSVFLYGLTGVLWITNGLHKESVFSILVGAVWLIGAVRLYLDKNKKD